MLLSNPAAVLVIAVPGWLRLRQVPLETASRSNHRAYSLSERPRRQELWRAEGGRLPEYHARVSVVSGPYKPPFPSHPGQGTIPGILSARKGRKNTLLPFSFRSPSDQPSFRQIPLISPSFLSFLKRLKNLAAQPTNRQHLASIGSMRARVAIAQLCQ